MEEENKPVVEETTPKTFDEVLKDNNYQSEFDRRVAKALETSKAKWEEDFKTKLENEKTEAQKIAKMDTEQKLNYQLEQANKKAQEAEARLNAYELKEQAIKIATEKELPVGYLNLIDFSKISADNLKATIDTLVETRSKDLEAYIKDKVKEPSPTTIVGSGTGAKDIPLIF